MNRPPTDPGSLGALEASVMRLQWEHEQTQSRLRDGAATMAALREKVERPFPRWISAGLLFTIAVFVGGMIWTAARYPERGEFDQLKNKQVDLASEQSVIRTEISHIRDRQSQTAKAIEVIGEKIDKIPQGDAITGRRRPRR